MDPINSGPDYEYYDSDLTYQITTYGADFAVDGLVSRFDRGDIFRPEFQRNFVWSPQQASRFIESILLGLPIPSVFLYREEDTERHLIVDGLQRLTTLHGFATGTLPGTQSSFRLRNVQPRFLGRTIRDLEPSDQRRFYNAIIHSIIIQQQAPDDDRSSVFHIFERLNSNGTPLRAQEMRAAIYHGEFQKLLSDLNDLKTWRQIFGAPHKRSKDQELILRFLAFQFDRDNYRKPMAAFLNAFMARHRNLPGGDQDRFSFIWASTINRIVEALGDNAFKPNRALNVAIFDSFACAVASVEHASPSAIARAYRRLLEDQEYRQVTEKATSDEGSVLRRFELAADAVRAAA